MKLREISEMIKQDSQLDITKLDHQSLEIAYLQGKYFNLYTDEKGRLRALEYKMKGLEREKYDYYSGNASAEVYKEKPFHLNLKTKTAIDSHIRNDEDVLALEREIDIQEMKVELIADMKNSLNQRTWHIKNAIEFLKFKNGLN